MHTIHTSAKDLTVHAADPYHEQVMLAARRYRSEVADLTQSEREFLNQVIGSSYGFKAVYRLAEIAARAETRGQAALFAEAIRGLTMRLRAQHVREPVSEIALWHGETRAQALADVAQSAVIVSPSRANRESAIQHTTEHIEWALRLRDVQQQQYPARTTIVVP